MTLVSLSYAAHESWIRMKLENESLKKVTK